MRATCARVTVHFHSERPEHTRRQAFLLAQDPEQEMFRADVAVSEGARLVLREHDDLSRALGEALEHAAR